MVDNEWLNYYQEDPYLMKRQRNAKSHAGVGYAGS
jgi:hypothetical protein